MELRSTKDKKFDSIYRAYKDSIFKVAMHYTKCEDLANDITQKTFFQLYTYFESVDLDSLYPWLITTARNLTFNYNRSTKHEILGDVFEIIKKTKDSVCYINKWYDAVTQVYCFGKSQQEAAKQLGIAVEVLNSRLYRARQWIRKNYEKEYREVVNWF